MRKLKRLIALGTAGLLLASTALTGCGGSSSGESASTAGTASAETTAAEGTDSSGTSEGGSGGWSSDTLTVGLTTSSMVTDYENNYFTNYLEEQLGFNLEFQMLPTDSADTRTRVALMATGGDGADLPDVIVVDGHLTTEMIYQYGSQGFFLALDEYLADPEVMPNYNAIPEEDKAIMTEAQTMADGHQYSLSAYEPESWNLTPYRLLINREWLDTLGLEVPTTTDELKDVLIAFRDGDPNGNGVQDEVGVYGFTTGWGTNVTAALMNAFVFWNGNDANGGLSLAEDGTTVIAPYTTEEWREGLRYMNDLYNEGVLSANIFTDDETQFKAVLNQETNTVGLVTAGSLSNWTDARNNANYLQMEFIEPLTGPEGIQYTPYTVYSPTQELMILSSTDKLDMALAFADQFYDHDTSIIERFGEEGVDWTRDPEVLAEHTNAYVDAGLYDSLSLVVLSTVWSDNQSQTWRNHGPRYASAEEGNTVFDFSSGIPYDRDDPTQLNARNYEMYYDKHPDVVLPTLKYTLEETEANQDAITNIPDFVKQSLAEFVTGARDIENGWDTYLTELENMGLSQWIEAAQAAYDRTLE